MELYCDGFPAGLVDVAYQHDGTLRSEFLCDGGTEATASSRY